MTEQRDFERYLEELRAKMPPSEFGEAMMLLMVLREAGTLAEFRAIFRVWSFHDILQLSTLAGSPAEARKVVTDLKTKVSEWEWSKTTRAKTRSALTIIAMVGAAAMAIRFLAGVGPWIILHVK